MFKSLIVMWMNISSSVMSAMGYIGNMLRKSLWFYMTVILFTIACFRRLLQTFMEMFADLIDMLNAMVTNVNSEAVTDATSGLGDVLALANTLLPLEETFALIAILSNLWLIAIGYRLLKSWIPTLA